MFLVFVLLYITLVLCRNDFSTTLHDLFNHVVDVLREKFLVHTELNVVYDDKCVDPLLIVNEYEPVVLNRLPPLESLLNVLLAIADINKLSVSTGMGYVEAEA